MTDDPHSKQFKIFHSSLLSHTADLQSNAEQMLVYYKLCEREMNECKRAFNDERQMRNGVQIVLAEKNARIAELDKYNSDAAARIKELIESNTSLRNTNANFITIIQRNERELSDQKRDLEAARELNTKAIIARNNADARANNLEWRLKNPQPLARYDDGIGDLGQL